MVVDKKLYSLRQYDLDQVLRVERGSLLSVLLRGTPRSVIYNYTLIFQAVNLIKTNAARDGGCSKRSTLAQANGRGVSILPSSATRAGSGPVPAPGNQ